MGAEEITQVDQVAEVLARVAGEHQWRWGIFQEWPRSGCTCGARDRAIVDINSSEISAAEHRAHVAAIQAAALVAAGLVVEGTEIEVWGVRFSTGRVYETNTERSAVELSAFCGEVVHRTRTTYPDCVTEWVAVDEGGE